MNSMWKDSVFERWWPLGQAMTLVRAPIRRVARAMKAEGKRANRSSGQVYEYDWVAKDSVEDLFSSVENFTIGGSMQFAIPTTGKWTVIWDNSSLCTPENFGYRLTMFQKLETISFYATDQNSTQLAGTTFTHRRPRRGEEVIERSVYCCNQGKRWHFQQSGEPLPEEDIERYSARRKRDRMNEAAFMSLLERLGVQPWRESAYRFQKKCFRMTDARQFAAAEDFTFEQVRARALGEGPPPSEDEDLHGPPDYLLGRCGAPDPKGPSRLLKNGDWCGHGEQTFWIYNVFTRNDDEFAVRLPEPDGVPVVEVTPKSANSFAIYDGRRHPANVFFGSDRQAVYGPHVKCPKCASDKFRVAVGFEVPAGADSANDTSWFALALECVACGYAQIAYDHETA